MWATKLGVPAKMSGQLDSGLPELHLVEAVAGERGGGDGGGGEGGVAALVAAPVAAVVREGEGAGPPLPPSPAAQGCHVRPPAQTFPSSRA